MRQPAKNKRDPEGTRRRILDAATTEFHLGGLAGARVDGIARRASTNERMLYYYFGSKEQLFVAVLEKTYDAFVSAQSALRLDDMPPVPALTTFAQFVWDYYRSHPEVVRLINNENLHRARYLRQSRIRQCMAPVLSVLVGILEKGMRAGVFRPDIDPLRCYVSISALGYYAVSNRYTLAETIGRDFSDPEEQTLLVRQHTDMLLAYVRGDGACASA
ncbi:TetR family transcriptional regulator [Robbsia sp. Bb-Pol-6]|uniref:TetR family transcriptional regulator n=1 Tax=Robbsia betulipollinis TaxID=2981849 RepID=A0ABT3ZPV4_9BURK|nr:TetR/AcrR family transcriptional regulator [Robbsia betulipollinis]MCY0388581.1 TetR family transcriptional regulator [Robbsia betulipollinis]